MEKKDFEHLEFWDKERFKNRSLKIMGGPEVISIPVPDDVILCDFCNTQITGFPVPVYLGNALCSKCFKELKESIKKEEKK
jgi:hypothetical protein